jgi:hypothetical protein
MIALLFRGVVMLPNDIYYLIEIGPNENPNIPYYKQESYLNMMIRKLEIFFVIFPLNTAMVVNLTRWVLILL